MAAARLHKIWGCVQLLRGARVVPLFLAALNVSGQFRWPRYFATILCCLFHCTNKTLGCVRQSRRFTVLVASKLALEPYAVASAVTAIIPGGTLGHHNGRRQRVSFGLFPSVLEGNGPCDKRRTPHTQKKNKEPVKPGEQDGGTRARPTPPEGCPWRSTHTPTAVSLFSYSSLTFNRHRIHYDSHWAVEKEGYRNLVVHGPYTMQLLVDFLRDHCEVDGALYTRWHSAIMYVPLILSLPSRCAPAPRLSPAPPGLTTLSSGSLSGAVW